MFKWLNGKKTILGVLGLAVAHGLEKANILPGGTVDTIATMAKALVGIGLAHKADKLTVAVATKATGGGGTGQ